MKSKLVAMMVLTVTLITGGCAREVAPTTPAIVGEWRSSVGFNTGAFAAIKNLEFMYVFNLGGTMTESSNYDAVPPVPPAYGIWRSLGDGEFEAKYEFFVTQAPSGADELIRNGGWLPSGRGVLVERFTLSPNGESFTSKVRFDVFDLEGRPTGDSGEGVGRGVRLAF